MGYQGSDPEPLSPSATGSTALVAPADSARAELNQDQKPGTPGLVTGGVEAGKGHGHREPGLARAWSAVQSLSENLFAIRSQYLNYVQ